MKKIHILRHGSIESYCGTHPVGIYWIPIDGYIRGDIERFGYSACKRCENLIEPLTLLAAMDL